MSDARGLHRSICVAHDVHTVLCKARGRVPTNPDHSRWSGVNPYDLKDPKALKDLKEVQKEIDQSIDSLLDVNLEKKEAELEAMFQARGRLEEELAMLNRALN